MEQETLNHFKDLFNQQRDDFIKAQRELDLESSWDQKGDEIDKVLENQNKELLLKLKGRENFFIKKIDEALRRVEEGSFGVCDECECHINMKRLIARPTTTMCIACKEEEERSENNTFYEKRSKTYSAKINNLGTVISFEHSQDEKRAKTKVVSLKQPWTESAS